MSIARFVDMQNKSATVALFAPATAYRLVAKNTPADVRDEVLGRAEAGEVLADGTVCDMIRKAVDERKAAKVNLLREKAKSERKKLRHEHSRHQQQYEAQLKREEEHALACAETIIDQFGADVARSFLKHLGNDAWRVIRKLDGLLPTEMRRLKQLEDENAKLKKLVADLSLDKEMLQDVIRRKP